MVPPVHLLIYSKFYWRYFWYGWWNKQYSTSVIRDILTLTIVPCESLKFGIAIFNFPNNLPTGVAKPKIQRIVFDEQSSSPTPSVTPVPQQRPMPTTQHSPPTQYRGRGVQRGYTHQQQYFRGVQRGSYPQRRGQTPRQRTMRGGTPRGMYRSRPPMYWVEHIFPKMSRYDIRVS